jgi:hypothetical protein
MSEETLEIEELCFEKDADGFYVGVLRKRKITANERYDWLRPPTQLWYFRDVNGKDVAAENIASGEWIDTKDGGFLIRGERLSDEEVIKRHSIPMTEEEVAEFNRLQKEQRERKI